ncbi:hypothetical protein ACSBR2_029331 [Camellia fascicularis]
MAEDVEVCSLKGEQTPNPGVKQYCADLGLVNQVSTSPAQSNVGIGPQYFVTEPTELGSNLLDSHTLVNGVGPNPDFHIEELSPNSSSSNFFVLEWTVDKGMAQIFQALSIKQKVCDDFDASPHVSKRLKAAGMAEARAYKWITLATKERNYSMTARQAIYVDEGKQGPLANHCLRFELLLRKMWWTMFLWCQFWSIRYMRSSMIMFLRYQALFP